LATDVTYSLHEQVLIAHAKGLAWPVTTGLYLVSDLVLAIAFEPILRLVSALCEKIPFLARLSAALKAAMARSTEQFSGTGSERILQAEQQNRVGLFNAGDGLVIVIKYVGQLH